MTSRHALRPSRMLAFSKAPRASPWSAMLRKPQRDLAQPEHVQLGHPLPGLVVDVHGCDLLLVMLLGPLDHREQDSASGAEIASHCTAPRFAVRAVGPRVPELLRARDLVVEDAEVVELPVFMRRSTGIARNSSGSASRMSSRRAAAASAAAITSFASTTRALRGCRLAAAVSPAHVHAWRRPNGRRSD